MLLKDLLNEETAQEYLQRLVRTLKIKSLGQGAFASVFQHPVYHNVAVKFFSYDPMYMKYIKLCQKHPENPWLPKVVSVHKLKMDELDKYGGATNGHEDAYLVFFQKLRKATPAEIKAAVLDIFSDMPDRLFDDDDREDFSVFEFRRDELYDFDSLFLSDWKAIAKYTKRPDVKQLAKILVSVDAEDIHDGNVMMRDEGDRTQLVFTDPVAS